MGIQHQSETTASARSRPLRAQLMRGTIAPMLSGLVALAMVISATTLSRLEREVGNTLAAQAYYFAELLDMTIGRQLMDLQSRAALLPELRLHEQPLKLAQWLTVIQRSIPEYAWIGYANADGLIVASGNHVLEGHSVVDRDWYREGRQQARTVDLHDAKLLAASLPVRDDGQPWRFIDVTAPVIRRDGTLLGVLGAHLSWDWLIAQQQRFTSSLRLPHRVEVIVTSTDGSPRLLGVGLEPHDARALHSHRDAALGNSGWSRETWPDGQTYLVGYTRHPGYGEGHQLNWVTLIRVPLREAVPLTHQSIVNVWLVVLGAALIFILAAWLLLQRSLRPIERLMHDIGAIARDGGRVQWNRHTPHEFVLLAQATNQLITAMEAGQLADQAKSRFLADMSHEIRTPLHGLMGHAELLKRQLDSASHHSDLDHIIACAKELHELVNDILDLAAIEEQRIVLEREPFVLDDMIHANVALFAPLAHQKSLDYQLKTHGSDGVTILGDRRRLGQIVKNMLSNAVKFTDHGSVTISVRLLDAPQPAMPAVNAPIGDAILTIEVRDTGIGLRQSQQDVIFGRFQQADVSTAARYGGSGLGLPVSRALGEAMGGQLALESELGRGTCISIAIPVTMDRHGTEIRPHAPAAAAQTATRTLHALRVLVVDDVAINRQLLIRWCAMQGHQATEAATAAEALAITDQQTFDLVVMDIDLPDGNGLDVVRLIRARPTANPPVIVALSGHAFDHDVTASRDAGCNDHLIKPLKLDELEERVARLMRLASRGLGETPAGLGNTPGAHSPGPSPEVP